MCQFGHHQQTKAVIYIFQASGDVGKYMVVLATF